MANGDYKIHVVCWTKSNSYIYIYSPIPSPILEKKHQQKAIREHLHLKVSSIEMHGLFFVQLLKAFLAAEVSNH
jgi:hypothetical protein